jgi:diguanylate cyclase
MSTTQWLALAPMMAFLLAGVAGVAYILGRRSQTPARTAGGGPQNPGVIGRELNDISQGVRRRLATHHANILQFRERISRLLSGQDGPDCRMLVQEAERVLKPTEALSDEIAQAYNEIRQQTVNLPEWEDDRRDKLTGLDSRRSIEETILFLLALKARYNNVFSLVLVDIDRFADFNRQQGRAEGERVLRELAGVINDSMRDTDAAGRFEGEEFVIVLPETGLQGAGVFGERLREKVEQRLPITLSCGLATVADGDTPQTILARADSALYSAKSAGHNCVFQHSGRSINLVSSQVLSQFIEREEFASTIESTMELAAATIPATNP